MLKIYSIHLLAWSFLLLISCETTSKKDTTDLEETKGPEISISTNIVYTDLSGNKITQDELKSSTGTYNWQIMDKDKNISNEARTLHNEARVLGSEGKYEESIEKLTKAMELAPEWAYPRYDLAYTYLLQQNYIQALNYYEETDRLEPTGFFTAKTACWSLRKENQGLLPAGLYLAYLKIEWAESDEEKLSIARALVKQFPTYAPAWKEIAAKSDDLAEREEAADQGLAAEPDLETKGVLLINKALVLQMKGNQEMAVNVLGELILSTETTVSNREMAKFVLNSITEAG